MANQVVGREAKAWGWVSPVIPLAVCVHRYAPESIYNSKFHEKVRRTRAIGCRHCSCFADLGVCG
jgi:hypothetical protein